MSGASTYSLWLIPQGPAAARLQALIAQLSREFHALRFAPHVTLLGGITGDEDAILHHGAQLAAGLAPFPVVLTDIGWEDAYYRCLYIRVQPTPELIHAHRRAREVFALAGNGAFQPHLSLLYAGLPEAHKAALARRLDRHYPTGLRQLRMALYATQGPPAGWRRIGSFEMGG